MQSDVTPVQVPLLARDGSIAGYTTVDLADAGWASRWTWRMQRHGNIRYAVRSKHVDGVFFTFMLHRGLFGLPPGREPQVDHIDRDGLNNVRSNLHVGSLPENMQNKSLQTSNTSGYRGVSWHKQAGKWQAYGSVSKKRYHLGLFLTPEEAADVAKLWRRENMPFATD